MSSNKTKTCKECNKTKPLDSFYKNKNCSLGREPICKDCKQNDPERKLKARKSYRKHRKKILTQKKKYYKDNLGVMKKRQRNNYVKHREQRLKDAAKYRSENKEKISKSHKKWYRKNKKSKNKKDAEYKERRMKTDINYKLTIILRQRMNKAVAKNYKVGSAVKDLGCSIEEFKKWLESLFYPNPKTGKPMTWKNYGKGKHKWQIDHKEALCMFDLTDIKQLKKACHYTNMQPLWYSDHATKSAEDRNKAKANRNKK
jgi:hypothetical protein